MEKEYCKQGAHTSYPVGTIHRAIVLSEVCGACPLYGKCEQAEKAAKDFLRNYNF